MASGREWRSPESLSCIQELGSQPRLCHPQPWALESCSVGPWAPLSITPHLDNHTPCLGSRPPAVTAPLVLGISGLSLPSWFIGITSLDVPSASSCRAWERGMTGCWLQNRNVSPNSSLAQTSFLCLETVPVNHIVPGHAVAPGKAPPPSSGPREDRTGLSISRAGSAAFCPLLLVQPDLIPACASSHSGLCTDPGTGRRPKPQGGCKVLRLWLGPGAMATRSASSRPSVSGG